MNCEEVREVLNAFLNGGMSGEKSRAIRLHLASCFTCASRLSPSEKIELLPVFDETIEPSKDFSERFHIRLQRRGIAHVLDFPERERRITSSLFWVLAKVGAVAAILLGGVFLVRHPIDTSIPPDYVSELTVAQKLNLLEDMAVISNLDLLENFDGIEKMAAAPQRPNDQRSRQ